MGARTETQINGTEWLTQKHIQKIYIPARTWTLYTRRGGIANQYERDRLVNESIT